MYQNAGRRNREWAMRLGGVAALGLLLGLSGCSPDYVTSNSARVNLIIASINNGAQLDSDVRNGAQSTFVCENEVDVAVAVREKNPTAPTPSVPDAVILKSYEVRYFRTDGRGTEGVDVPYIGPADLSASYGHLGNQSHPDVQKAIDRVYDATRAAGLATGIHEASGSTIKARIEKGYNMVTLGNDLIYMRRGVEAHLKELGIKK